MQDNNTIMASGNAAGLPVMKIHITHEDYGNIRREILKNYQGEDFADFNMGYRRDYSLNVCGSIYSPCQYYCASCEEPIISIEFYECRDVSGSLAECDFKPALV